ncbi:36778_t:CDS:2, partial [Gigaspora margarita]
MYNEESSPNINNNLSTEWITDFTLQDQININSPNIYNNPSTEWSADFTQVYEDQINNSLPTEWSMELAQNQTTISLPNVYNNPFIEWSTGFSQDQIIELSTKFTNNNPFMEWNKDFTQTNTSFSNIYNNSIIKLPAGITQNDVDQTNHDLSIEQTACFAQDRTNTSLHSINNTGITQYYEAQFNDLQQFDAKSVIEDKHQVSFVSRNKKRKERERCKKCNRKRFICDETSKKCRNCYEASLRVLSGNKLIDDFIELTQISYASFTRDSNLEFIPGLQQYHGITKHPETKNYIIVIEFAQNRDLHYFLNKNANTLSWLSSLIGKTNDGVIKFTDSKGTNISPTEINDQAFYSSRPLTPLISKALTLQSMRLNSNVIT